MKDLVSRRPVSGNTALLVLRLADEGVSQAEIARALQIGEKTVHRIVHGRWFGFSNRHECGKPVDGDATNSAHAELAEDAGDRRSVVPMARRCPDCGGRTLQWPCLVCQVRRSMVRPVDGVAGPSQRTAPPKRRRKAA